MIGNDILKKEAIKARITCKEMNKTCHTKFSNFY